MTVQDGAKAWCEYGGIKVEVSILPSTSPSHVILVVKKNGVTEIERLEPKVEVK